MKTIVRETGRRPAVATPARINAPQGAIALAQLFEPHDFADMVTMTIDWEDGCMYVDAAKWHREWPGQPILNRPYAVDLEDAFGMDNMENSTLREIVEGFRTVFVEAYERRKRGEAAGDWYDKPRTIYDT